MRTSFWVHLYRYYLFVIAIISNAIICSAAAWNLPFAKNADLHSQLRVDSYMIFLGAFSLLVVIPLLFADVLSEQAITGRVWVECLWVDLLWLLHIVSAVVATTTLPLGICSFQANRINDKSCTSAKLLIAFSWISTINLFMYLIFLVISAILHQKQDDTIWSAQVRSYPWYRHFYCHKLASSPEIPRPPDQVPVAAPRPWRPIRLPTQSMISSLYLGERTHDRQSGITEPRGPPPTMQETKPGPTALYPLFIRASVLEPTIRPSPTVEGSLRPGLDRSQQHALPDVGVPPPLWDWPRADIMSLPPPRRAATRKAPASSLPSVIEPSHEREGGLPRGLPSTPM